MSYLTDYTILDIETTGLNPNTDCIIELSAIKIRNNEINSQFSELVNPNRFLNNYVKHLTGITDEMLEDAPTIETVLPKFIHFLGKDTLLGHNIKFDIGFIKQNLKKYFDWELTNQTMDTMYIAKSTVKLPSYKLSSIAEYYNIDTKNNHRGLKDCYITFEVYNRLISEEKNKVL